MDGHPMRTGISKPLPAVEKAELDALAALPDDKMNTAALPEQTDWSDRQRGLFFLPIKKQLTLRLDADLIHWFKTHLPTGEGYQSRINRALREYVTQHDNAR